MPNLLRKSPDELLAELKAEDELEEWQTAFARYLSAHPFMRLKNQCKVASRLAGTDIGPSELRRVKYKPAWQDLWFTLRAEHDDYKRRAEERIKKLMPRAARIAGKMLDQVEKELQQGDAMGAVRAGTPLVGEFLQRAMPRRLETGGAQQAVIINLSPAQAAALNAPVPTVSAEEVKALPAGES